MRGAMTGMMFGPQAVAQLRADHRKLKRIRVQQTTRKKERPRKNRIRVAIIGSLAAPTSATGTPTSCTAAVLKMDPVTKQLSDSGKRVTLHNYSTDLECDDGTYGKAEFDGVWELYWVNCTPDATLQDLPTEPFDPEAE
jgi:hypothetical protein